MSLGGNKNELACVYAALILHDEGMEITSENIAKILKASGIETEAYWPNLFAKLCNLGPWVHRSSSLSWD